LLRPWRWMRNVPPKHLVIFTELHRIITQTTTFENFSLHIAHGYTRKFIDIFRKKGTALAVCFLWSRSWATESLNIMQMNIFLQKVDDLMIFIQRLMVPCLDWTVIEGLYAYYSKNLSRTKYELLMYIKNSVLLLLHVHTWRSLNAGVSSSSRLLSKNIKTRIYKTIILPVVLYGCETWSLTLREKHRLEGVWEQCAEENIWTKDRWSDRRLGKTA
jgi:hypothetical protein